MNIEDTLHQLLSATPAGEAGGFAIFSGDSDLDYVQLALNAEGLLLSWPTFQPGGRDRLEPHLAVLSERGFKPSSRGGVQDLPPHQFVVVSDGLYARCSRDIIETGDLVRALLLRVFKRPGGLPTAITLELDG